MKPETRALLDMAAGDVAAARRDLAADAAAEALLAG